MSKSSKQEVVAPANHIREDLWVALLVLTILLLAGGLLSLRSPPPEQVHGQDPPDEIRQLVTELVIAADEINFLVAAGELAAKPTVSALQEAGIPPFDLWDFTEPAPGCYVLDAEDFHLRLRLDNQAAMLHWQASHQAAHATDNLCENEHGHWTAFSADSR